MVRSDCIHSAGCALDCRWDSTRHSVSTDYWFMYRPPYISLWNVFASKWAHVASFHMESPLKMLMEWLTSSRWSSMNLHSCSVSRLWCKNMQDLGQCWRNCGKKLQFSGFLHISIHVWEDCVFRLSLAPTRTSEFVHRVHWRGNLDWRWDGYLPVQVWPLALWTRYSFRM